MKKILFLLLLIPYVGFSQYKSYLAVRDSTTAFGVTVSSHNSLVLDEETGNLWQILERAESSDNLAGVSKALVGGSGGESYDDAFDGDRVITNIPTEGVTNFGTDDMKGWMNSFYDVAPVATLSVTPEIYTYEYNDGSDIPITLNYEGERPTGCGAIVTATLVPPTISLTSIIALASGASHDSTWSLNQTGNVNTTYTLTVASASLSDVATRTIRFIDQRYWGVDANGTLTNAEILQFETNGDSDFSSGYSSAGVVYDFDDVDNEHVVIVIPYHATYPRRAKIGVLEADISSYFTVQGAGIFSLTTATGGSRAYKILTSINKYGVSELQDVQVTLIQ